MANANYMQQTEGVGVLRSLKLEEIDHLVCLLRVIERLPELTAKPSDDPATLRLQFDLLHQNITEIAAMAQACLSIPASH